ncbi:hypothetical protein [Clostridium botulinum]|nr:hypothetical protein [Clostridium botulinum]
MLRVFHYDYYEFIGDEVEKDRIENIDSNFSFNISIDIRINLLKI